jgi:hypothetical protein
MWAASKVGRYVVQVEVDVNVGHADAISPAGTGEMMGSWQWGVGAWRATGFGEPALVLRRTLPPVAAQDEGYSGLDVLERYNTHRLMVSSAKRVRRTMGDEGIMRDTLEALADDRFGIGGPAGEC